MLTLLLADDEKITREGICCTVDWQAAGIGRVLQAANGLAALEVIRREKPDILLTDVKMPLLDGIALAKQVRGEYPETRIIFISGYADVEYLKAAVQEQAVDYILKPIDQDELAAAVGRAVDELNGQRKRQHQQENMRYLIQKSLPFYRANFFSRLFASDTDMKTLQEQFSLCDFPFPDTGSFTAALVSLRYDGDAGTLDAALLTAETEELLTDYVKKHAAGYVYRNNNTLFTLVLFSPQYEEIPDRLFHTLLSFLTAQLPIQCSVGVGNECTGLYDIGESCQCAEIALSRQFREGMGQVYFYEEGTQNEMPQFSVDAGLIDRLCASVTSRNKELGKAATQEFMDSLNALELVNLNYIHYYCTCFLSAVLSRLYAEKGRMSVDHLELLIRSQTVLLSCKTMSDIGQCIGSILEELAQMFSQSTRSQSQLAAQAVIAYLEKHYQEDVTIREMAAKLYITPAYLCRLFKKATSRTINEYLTELRIRKAKELLALGRYHLYEIAPMVGYQDIKYFSRIFRDRTGLTPSDYAGRHR